MFQGALLFVFTMYTELHKMDCMYLLQQVCGWYFPSFKVVHGRACARTHTRAHTHTHTHTHTHSMQPRFFILLGQVRLWMCSKLWYTLIKFEVHMRRLCQPFTPFNNVVKNINPLMPELNPSEQCCLLRFFIGHFKFYCLLLGVKKHIS
jgi:hypothetical protein